MKKHTGTKVTAAIGDGANDVNMIQQAHIGFGLMGKEGNQAAAFADYAFPRFKDLRRALFWHGRPYGLRLNNYVLWCLYKSVINATSKYVANFENGWSGDQPVDNLMMALYNVTFTVWFIVFQSVYDQDVSFANNGNPDKEETSEKGLSFHMSDLYVYTRYQLSMKKFTFLVIGYDIYALFTGWALYYIFYYSSAPGVMNAEGQMYGYYAFGLFGTVACVAIHHVQVLMNTRNLGPVLGGFLLLSVSLSFLTVWWTSLMKGSSLTHAMYQQVLASGMFFLMIVFAVAFHTLPLYLIKQVRQTILHPQFFTA
jgi:magnesium-transporting ATPase (P-type)